VEPNDIKLTFNSADLLPKACDRVVFDIGGNNYRMLCGYKFRKKEVYLYINWIGTHAEYSKICKNSEQYTISLY
jgi:mRNA interferase HigB